MRAARWRLAREDLRLPAPNRARMAIASVRLAPLLGGSYGDGRRVGRWRRRTTAWPRTHSSRRDRPDDPFGTNPGVATAGQTARSDDQRQRARGGRRPAAGPSRAGFEINTFGAGCASVGLALVAAIGAREVQPGHGRPAPSARPCCPAVRIRPVSVRSGRHGSAARRPSSPRLHELRRLPTYPSQELQRDNRSVCPSR
jgi:hypothetical protein